MAQRHMNAQTRSLLGVSLHWRCGIMIIVACALAVSMVGCQSGQHTGSGLTDADGNELSQQAAIDEAQAASEAGDYEVALGLFRDILEENPTIAPAYIGIGDIYMAEEDYAQAEPVFAQAAKLEPRNFDAQFGHGRALQMLGDFLTAIRAYHRALTIDPNHPQTNHNIATSYMQLQEMASALVFAEKAVELLPEDGAAHVNLGAIYEALGSNDKAIDEYLVALELLEGEDTAPVMLNLINVLGDEHRYQEAANTAENLTRIAPSANAYERLGWTLFRLTEYEQAMEAYQAAVDIDPNHWPSLNGVGIIALNDWLNSDRTDTQAKKQARDAFRRSLRINRKQQKLITMMSVYDLR